MIRSIDNGQSRTRYLSRPPPLSDTYIMECKNKQTLLQVIYFLYCNQNAFISVDIMGLKNQYIFSF